ncbi:hypothetical protein D3C71_1087180 [compost metagenome]
MRAVLHHQQPARQARRNLVVALACRRQRLLVQARQQAGLEQGLQFGNRVDLRAQLLGADAPAGPGPLHQRPPRCGRQPQNQLRPQHRLSPDHANFERGVAVHIDHQGQETFNGKVGMLQRLAPHAQLCGKHQFERFAVVQQLLARGRAQLEKKGIFGAVHRGVSQVGPRRSKKRHHDNRTGACPAQVCGQCGRPFAARLSASAHSTPAPPDQAPLRKRASWQRPWAATGRTPS